MFTTNEFCTTAITYNMAVSTSKTKTLTIAKEPVQCKLLIDDTLLVQVTTFKYRVRQKELPDLGGA